MNKKLIAICTLLLLATAILCAGCVDNGIATDHANESICGTWVCEQGLVNDTIVLSFYENGTAELEDTLPDGSELTNTYTWNRLADANRYLAVSSSGERVEMTYHPENETLIDNAGNQFALIYRIMF